MLAYQMIYTACGKDKSGAFSVWAKSSCITKQECDEIIKLMSYRKPKNVPYDPTKEEIERLFPKKYAFFHLSSGKKCIAQSSYIGRVYSDLDERSGNFIIHAYVFDKLDFNPFLIFKMQIFKKELTYEEWHNNPAPTDLPPVEIASLGFPNEAIVKNVITKYGSNFKLMLEGIFQSCESDQNIIINAKEEELSDLYSVIGTFVPASYWERLTFSNQYSSQTEYSIQSAGGILVKIRSIYDGLGVAYSYQEDINYGKLVFNFEKGLFSPIEIKRYVQTILSDVNRLSYFELLKKIDKIKELMKNNSCDINTATALYDLLEKKYDSFIDAKSFIKIFEIAIEKKLVNVATIAQEIYNQFFINTKEPLDLELLNFIKILFPYLSLNMQEKIIIEFLSEVEKYVSSKLSFDDYHTEFCKIAPFSIEKLLYFIANKQEVRELISNGDSFNVSYLVFMKIYDEKLFTDTTYSTFIYNIIKKYLSSKDFQKLNILIKIGTENDENFEDTILKNLILPILVSSKNTDVGIEESFEYIQVFNASEMKAQCLELIINMNINHSSLIKYYQKYSENNRLFINEFERKASKNIIFEKFLEKKEMFEFEQTKNVTMELLEQYHKKNYLIGLDKGKFFEKIKEKFAIVKGKEKIKQIFDIYNLVRNQEDEFQDTIAIIDFLEKQLFEISIKELIALTEKEIKWIDEMHNRLEIYSEKKTSEIYASKKYQEFQTGLLIIGKRDEKEIDKKIEEANVYEELTINQKQNIFEVFSNEIIKMYFEKRDKKNRTISLSNLINGILLSFINVSTFEKVLINSLDKLKDDDYYKLLCDLMSFAFNETSFSASKLKTIIEKYVDSLSKGEYKKLFKIVLDNTEEDKKEKVKAYIDDYLENHKGFFDKLFSKNNKKKEE